MDGHSLCSSTHRWAPPPPGPPPCFCTKDPPFIYSHIYNPKLPSHLSACLPPPQCAALPSFLPSRLFFPLPSTSLALLLLVLASCSAECWIRGCSKGSKSLLVFPVERGTGGRTDNPTETLQVPHGRAGFSCGNMRKLLFISFVLSLSAAAVHGEDGKVPRALCSDPLCSSGCVWPFTRECLVQSSYSSCFRMHGWIDLHVRARCAASLLRF
jgi:hypothetical protein